MNPGISVVIPNFNGKALLEENLPTVFSALKSTNIRYEVIVADDGSSDDSVEFIKRKYPQIVLLAHPKNSGFSTNINSGLKLAQFDLVLALNNDVSLEREYFLKQLHHFHSEDTFGVMGALLDPKTHAVTDGAKLAEQSFFGAIRSTKNIVRNDDTPMLSFFLSGANALMDRKKLAAIGFFDEVFNPFYNEDVELSLRAWRMNWKCYFEPKAHAYHACSSTIKKVSNKELIRIISLRNRFVLHDIHLESVERFLFFCKLWWDLGTRWISLDFNFYKAFTSYRARKDAVRTSRETFLKSRPALTISEVVRKLKREQFKKPYRVFS